MATDPASGTSSREPFAYFDPDSSSWKMCQASLLEDSGESCTTWPRQVTWDLSYVYELPTSALHIFEIGSSSLLPTPQTADGTGGRLDRGAAENDWKRPSGTKAAKTLPTIAALLPSPSSSESTPTEEYVEEVRDHMADPHERLYLPGRKWHSQRTLSRVVPALLPTPGANDSTGGEGPTREARQEQGETGGPSLRDIGHLLPSPTVVDGTKGKSGPNADSPRSRLANLEQLLPTPTTQDAANTAGPSQLERNSEPLNVVAAKLLPTPVVMDAHGSRRATARTEEWDSNEGTTLTDAVWQVEGRTESSSSGESTSPLSDDGSRSSDEPPLDQLTIEDA